MTTKMTHNQYVHYLIHQMDATKSPRREKSRYVAATPSTPAKSAEIVTQARLLSAGTLAGSMDRIPGSEKMKALSIRQPYAGLIIAGIKNVENRTWAPKHTPGTLAIASTQTPNAAKWWVPMREKCAAIGATFPEALCRVNGSILGTVVFNCVVWLAEDGTPDTDSKTFDGSYWWDEESIGFIFEAPRRLLTPIPVTGRLGLYNLAAEIEAEIKKQLSCNP